MPIPKKYYDKTERENEHWFKTVTWETIEPKKIGGRDLHAYMKYEYEVKKIGADGLCLNCLTDEFVYLITMPSGVFRACLKCAATGKHSAFGPLPTEIGKGSQRKPIVKVLDTYDIMTDEDLAECAIKIGWHQSDSGWIP